MYQYVSFTPEGDQAQGCGKQILLTWILQAFSGMHVLSVNLRESQELRFWVADLQIHLSQFQDAFDLKVIGGPERPTFIVGQGAVLGEAQGFATFESIEIPQSTEAEVGSVTSEDIRMLGMCEQGTYRKIPMG